MKLFLLTLVAAAVIGLFAWNVLPHGPKTDVTLTQHIDYAAPIAPKVTFLDPVRGSTGTKKTIIAYGDFECLYCAVADETLTAYLAAHKDVRLVWKDFPLPTHAEAFAAAEASRCAGDQQKYWEYHDLLMSNQDKLGLTYYASAAAALKLDPTAFTTCFDEHRHAPQVQASFDEGVAAGVDAVPYFFVNGHTFSGAISADELANAFQTK